jgi:glycosyltransferase 2 family protein
MTAGSYHGGGPVVGSPSSLLGDTSLIGRALGKRLWSASPVRERLNGDIVAGDGAPRRRSVLRSPGLRFGAGLIISAVCLFLVFRDVQPGRLLAVFLAADRRWLAAAVLAVAPAFAATTVRWQLLLRPAGTVPFRRAGRLLAIGYLLNLVFPARPGDVLRCYLVGRPSGPAFGTAITTVVVEKALDGAAVVLLVLALLGEVAPDPWLRHGVAAAGAAFGAVLLAAVGLAAGGDRSVALLTAVLRRHPLPARQAVSLLARVRAGTRAFAQPRLLLGILALTMLVWVAALATAYSLAAAFGLTVASPLPALALGAATLGLVVPAAPGGIGTYQVLVLAVLTPAGVPAAEALAFALALQFCQILPLAALGAAAAPLGVVRPAPGSPE